MDDPSAATDRLLGAPPRSRRSELVGLKDALQRVRVGMRMGTWAMGGRRPYQGERQFATQVRILKASTAALSRAR
jgi:hypothetical protein